MSALGVVLALLPARGGWRNGRRARFRSVCPKGREGSNPSSPTRQLVLFAGRWPASRWSAALVRGGDPPEPPAWRTLWLWFLAVGQVATVARGRVWFLPLAGCRPYVGSRGRVWFLPLAGCLAVFGGPWPGLVLAVGRVPAVRRFPWPGLGSRR